MKKFLTLIALLCVLISGKSQNYFEKMITSSDGGLWEGMYSLETPDHGFIISCNVADQCSNTGLLLLLSSDGETIKELKHQISDNNLNYIGLFKMPGEEWRCLAVAVITKHDTNVQNSLAFVEFDENLDITGETICEFGDDYTSMSVDCVYPRSVMNSDGTITMVACCRRSASEHYLYANMNTEGEIIKMKEEAVTNLTYLSNLFARNNDSKDCVVLRYEERGSEFCNRLDSTMSTSRMFRLSGTDVKIVEYAPPQPYPYNIDTTYRYRSFPGNGLSCDDSTFFITGRCHYFKSLGGITGDCSFIAKVNDDGDVMDSRIWDIQKEDGQSVWSAFRKALAATGDAVYHAGVIGIQDHSHKPKPSVVTITKFDKEMNVKWHRYIGRDGAYYDINVIEGTEDGGCICTGIYSRKGNYHDFKIYALKLDAEGFDSAGELGEGMVKPYYCFPNPANESLNIEFSPDVNCRSVEIYSIDGRLVETFPETSPETSPATSQPTTIDISNLTPGIYILKVKTTDGKEYTERIVKE